MTSGHNSRSRKTYRDEVQKAGVSLHNQPFVQVPQKANAVTKHEPGLGAKTISHPFKATKPKI
jgi:hypothetical protein